MSQKLIGLWAICSALRFTCAQEFTAPVYNFLSRPDIRTPRLEVDTYDPAGVAPGYIFLTPWAPEVPHGVNYVFGPTIYDNDGELVWSGYNPAAPRLALMGFFLTQFDGRPHIGYAQKGDTGPIYGNILNERYELVRQVTLGQTPESTWYDSARDLHEFNVITPHTIAVDPANLTRDEVSNWLWPSDPQTALLVANGAREVIPPVQVCGQEISWVRDYPFQEISLDGENRVLFEWSALEHIPIDEADLCPGMMDHLVPEPHLQGSDAWHAFDFVHRNAVDKLPDGDFIMSARHMSTVYKISHVDGSILWRLGGGRRTDFNQTSLVPGVDMAFAFQHDVRFSNDIEGADAANGILGLTLWDNANARYDAKERRSERSMGKTILVDQNTMTATLVSAFALPGNKLGTNQGSHQALPNGNHLIGGGNIAEVAEYRASQGTWDAAAAQEILAPNARPERQQPVFSAHFGGGPMNSYRARRHEWSAYPTSKPDAFAYRKSCDPADGNRTFVYASWNGATEVAFWTVWGANQTGFRELTAAKRSGFETTIAVHHDETDADDQLLELYVVALDDNKLELGRSDPLGVWIPREDDLLVSRRASFAADAPRERLRGRSGECSEKHCRQGFHYSWDRAQRCSVPEDSSVHVIKPATLAWTDDI